MPGSSTCQLPPTLTRCRIAASLIAHLAAWPRVMTPSCFASRAVKAVLSKEAVRPMRFRLTAGSDIGTARHQDHPRHRGHPQQQAVAPDADVIEAIAGASGTGSGRR